MAHGVKKINEWIMKDGRVLNVTVNIDPMKLESGTQFVNPSTGLLNYVNVNNSGVKTWKKYDPNIIFDALSIKRGLIANLAINRDKIENRTITSDKIALDNVTNQEIGPQEVWTDNIKNLNVTTGKIADSAITSVKIQNGSITSDKLANPCVNSDKIVPGSILDIHVGEKALSNRVLADSTIISTKLANNSVITSKINNLAVTTDKIAAAAVNESKISIDSINNGHLKNNVVTTIKIKDGNVTDEKIVSLNGKKIVSKTIAETALADLSVSNRVLGNGAVSYAKLDTNLKDLIDRGIKVENEIIIGSEIYQKTAWVKGNLLVKHENNSPVKAEIKGDIIATGTVTASKCYNPVFADLAEAYIPTEEMESGDAVCLSLAGGLKIEKLTEKNSDRFIGFVSDEYATVFGATAEELKYKKKVAVTLVGRIKIKAINEIANIGDYVYIINGKVAFNKIRSCNAVGRVLENISKTDQYVLCQLWP